MSGHSKWSTIKRQKGANDAKRGLLFSKLARAITIAAKLGGIDPVANFKLRLAMEKAREANMPKGNIDRAIEKAKGGAGGDLFEITYEGYGPGGVAVLVEATTDNKNRTSQEIKNIFEKGEGSLGSPGSVAYQFEPKGLIFITAFKKTPLSGDELNADMSFSLRRETPPKKGGENVIEKSQNVENTMLSLMEIEEIENIEEAIDGIEAQIQPNKVFTAREKIEKIGYKVISAEIVMLPKNVVNLESDKEKKVLRLIENLDDHEDVQKVWANLG